MKEKLEALRAATELSEAGLADLLGVPIFTLKKWLAGQRKPSASAVRLVDVLTILSVIAPDMTASFANEGNADAGA